MVLDNRFEAGRLLAQRLQQYSNRADVLVLALPRGGVPVGFEIARALNVMLDVFVVRKLGVPGHEELAMGAIATGDVLILQDDIVQALHVPQEAIERVVREQEAELRRRQDAFRSGRPPVDLRGRVVILVDDGIATGSTMYAAIAALKKLDPARIVLAVPVAAPSTFRDLAAEVDEAICLSTPEPFRAVGEWYADFSQTTDAEVRQLLERAAQAVSNA
jgi:predicted phosphoribosyltransferase